MRSTAGYWGARMQLRNFATGGAPKCSGVYQVYQVHCKRSGAKMHRNQIHFFTSLMRCTPTLALQETDFTTVERADVILRAPPHFTPLPLRYT